MFLGAAEIPTSTLAILFGVIVILNKVIGMLIDLYKSKQKENSGEALGLSATVKNIEVKLKALEEEVSNLKYLNKSSGESVKSYTRKIEHISFAVDKIIGAYTQKENELEKINDNIQKLVDSNEEKNKN